MLIRIKSVVIQYFKNLPMLKLKFSLLFTWVKFCGILKNYALKQINYEDK